MEDIEKFSRKVYIGINSSGKTYNLNTIKNSINISSSKPSEDSKLTSATQIITDRLYNYFNESASLNEKFDEFLRLMIEEIGQLHIKINDFKITDNLNETILSKTLVDLSQKSDFSDFFKKTIHNLLESNIDELGEGHKQIYLVKLLLFNNISNKTLIVDEPESFLHPSLLKDFAIYLNKLSENNRVIVSSHSSLFVKNFIEDLSEIEIVDPFKFVGSKWSIDRNSPSKKIDDDFWMRIVNKLNSKVKERNINLETITNKWNRFKLNFIENNLFDLNKIKIWKDKFYSEIIESIFWRNTILAEGLIEKIIFENYLNMPSWQLIGTFGKDSMPLIGSILEELGINVSYVLDQDDIDNPLHIEFNKFFAEEKSLFFKPNMDVELQISWEGSNKASYTETKNKIEESKTKDAVLSKITDFLNAAIK